MMHSFITQGTDSLFLKEFRFRLLMSQNLPHLVI